MRRILLLITNILLAIAFIIQLITVISFKANFEFPFGLEKFEVHEWFGYALLILAIIHIILNWAWIKNNIFKRSKK